MKTAILIVACGVTLSAQVGGGYPPGGQYPPGQYPQGRYPGSGGPGLPIPHKGKKGDSSTDEKATLRISGVVRKLDTKSLDLASVDTRFMTIQISDKTTSPKDLKPGDPVRIEVTQDADGAYHAVSITIDPAVAKKMPKDALDPPGEAPAVVQVEERPTVLVKDGPRYDAGDSGPPKLKRGKPEEYAQAAPTASRPDNPPAVPVASLPPPPPTAAPSNPHQALIENAKEAAASFISGLPSYICQQNTTRYVSELHVNDWHALDLVSAETVYEDGKESYRNLQINGKSTKKSPEESGAWSTGEFGTILVDLFHPATAAAFRYVRDTTVTGMPASVYDFSVERSHSHWKIQVPGQFVQPAYKGSIWVDKKSARVLRIEMQAKEIPKEFPEDAVETAVDYQFVGLGSVTEKFLLPVHAEVLSCFRGTNKCERNVIDFRNYHKFSGESTIKFGQ